MRFKRSPQLPGAGRTRAWHHHGSDTPISPRAIYVLKSVKGPNILGGSVTVAPRLHNRVINFSMQTRVGC